jgi:predicted nucleic acid-binding protein
MAVMQQIMVDTSAYSAFLRGDTKLRPYFSSKNSITVPIIVIGELRAGFATGNKQHENEDSLQKFLDSPNVEGVLLTDKTTQLYSAIYARLKATGNPINTNDIWIAALTLEHDSLLLTLDSDFSLVPDLLLAKF